MNDVSMNDNNENKYETDRRYTIGALRLTERVVSRTSFLFSLFYFILLQVKFHVLNKTD